MLKVYSVKNCSLKSVIKQIFSDFNLSIPVKVFIKPNLGGRYPISQGENTRLDIIDSLCTFLAENGCQEILVGHSSLLSFGHCRYDFDTLIKGSKFYRLRKNRIVKLINLDTVERVKFQVDNNDFNIPQILQTHFYINLANLKTHMETGVSLTLKNQVGLLPANERMRKHQKDLDGSIASIGVVARPNFNIIDGRIGMEGNGPHHGAPKKTNLIFCGDDMVELDSLACRLIGIDPLQVRHITIAQDKGVGRLASDQQFFEYQRYFISFRKPDECYQKYKVVKVWPNKACSGCIFTLSEAHRKIRKNPFILLRFLLRLIRLGRLDVVLGKESQRYRQKYSSQAIIIGNCAKDLAEVNPGCTFLPGCPPGEEDIIKLLT